jgi:hypothetical protein
MTMRIWLIGLLLFSLVGCGKEELTEEDVYDLAMDYKAEYYYVPDPANPPTGEQIAGNVKRFLSEDAYQSLISNHRFDLVPHIAQVTNKSINLEEIILEKKAENRFSYLLKLKFYDDTTLETIEKRGELTISNEGDLIITRDREEAVKMGNEIF